MTDFSDMARGIIEAKRHMVLGTADEVGVPWVTPVWFGQSDHRQFIWVSSPERRHSRNVRARPEVSIVIFDSRVAVGSARAVYMSARGEELSGAQLLDRRRVRRVLLALVSGWTASVVARHGRGLAAVAGDV